MISEGIPTGVVGMRRWLQANATREWEREWRKNENENENKSGRMRFARSVQTSGWPNHLPSPKWMMLVLLLIMYELTNWQLTFLVAYKVQLEACVMHMLDTPYFLEYNTSDNVPSAVLYICIESSSLPVMRKSSVRWKSIELIFAWLSCMSQYIHSAELAGTLRLRLSVCTFEYCCWCPVYAFPCEEAMHVCYLTNDSIWKACGAKCAWGKRLKWV
jgi:hypothetical protein